MAQQPAPDARRNLADDLAAAAPSGDAGSLVDWLVVRLARHLRIPAAQVDVERPLATYGLDSLTTVTIIGELQKWLGRPLSPTIVYSAPTIGALAHGCR